MGKARWTLPYLIELGHPIGAQFDLQSLPGATAMTVEASVGPVTLGLGGPTWDLKWGVIDSLRGLVPEVVEVDVQVTPGRDMPDVLQQGAVHLVSARFREIVEPVARDCEFIPLRLYQGVRGSFSRRTAIVRDDYFWMNCWRRIDVIDPLWSRPRRLPARDKDHTYAHATVKFAGWDKLVLKPLPEDSDLFQIRHMFGSRLFISEALWRRLVEAEIKVRCDAAILDPSRGPAQARVVYAQVLNPWIFARYAEPARTPD